MRRREFIAALGGAAGWPVVACAQPTTMPVVGFVDTRSSGSYDPFVQGLSEVGFVDHHNVIINHREASNIDQLPAIALELVRDQAAVICGPTNAIIAARAVTATVPMVFIGGTDPVAVGLVASFSRPGGNVTGVRLIAGNLASKQLEILHELVPTARNIGLLISPQFPDAEPQADHRTGSRAYLGHDIRR